jgi:hypothetical protein
VFDYREATAMGIYRLWLDSKTEKVDALLRYFQSHHITAIRPLFNLGGSFWEGRGRQNRYTESGWFDQLVPFVRQCATFGIYVRCCLFGGVEAFGAQPEWRRRPDVVSMHPDVIRRMHAYLEQCVETLGGEKNVLFEIANEPGQIGFGADSRVILELGQHCKDVAPDRLMNFGAATDEDSSFYRWPPSDFLDEHLVRAERWDYFASIKRIWEHHAVDVDGPMMSGEWLNFGEDGETSSTATAFAAAAMMRIKRIIPAFHARALLDASVPGPETTACLRAWTRGLDRVPMQFVGSLCGGHWSCSPVSSDEFPATEDGEDDHDGPVRVAGRRGADGYIGISLREPAGHELRGAFETVDLDHYGDWQARLISANTRADGTLV